MGRGHFLPIGDGSGLPRFFLIFGSRRCVGLFWFILLAFWWTHNRQKCLSKNYRRTYFFFTYPWSRWAYLSYVQPRSIRPSPPHYDPALWWLSCLFVCIESPFTMNITDSRSVTVSGSGLTSAEVNQLTTFTVNTGQQSVDDSNNIQVFLLCTLRIHCHSPQ